MCFHNMLYMHHSCWSCCYDRWSHTCAQPFSWKALFTLIAPMSTRWWSFRLANQTCHWLDDDVRMLLVLLMSRVLITGPTVTRLPSNCRFRGSRYG